MKHPLSALAASFGITVDLLDEAASTNDVASDGRYTDGDIVIALSQTAGRGQRGNSWLSEKGKNLTFSIVLEPEQLEAEKQFQLSKAVTLALAATLDRYGLEARVKWPNDIYISSRKIAGILIENNISGAWIARSVVGIGLNVNQVAFDPALPNPTSVIAETGCQEDIFKILEEFYRLFMPLYRNLPYAGEEIDRLYLENLYLINEPHDFLMEGQKVKGIIRGIGPYGELLVEHDGKIVPYLFKEIEYLL